MRTVHEVAELSGVSVRALHYYDSIGLLRPTEVTPAGYRLYDDGALIRLQTILLFRSVGFSLAEIGRILDDPDFDRETALRDHIELLDRQKKHIDGLIAAAQKMLKGEDAGFTAFDRREMEKYAEEVRKKWGATKEYRESQEKMKNRTEEEKKKIADGLMEFFVRFGALKSCDPASSEVQSAVGSLQSYLSEHYYECSKKTLSGLGEMYVADERFRRNIDKAGGEGTAEFVRRAIAVFCA